MNAVTGPREHNITAGETLRGSNEPSHKRHSNTPAAAKSANNRSKPCPGLGPSVSANSSQKKNKRSSAARRRQSSVYGALDLGTNNCRLLVARPTRRGFVVVDAFSRIIRLGEGVSRTGQLSEEAMLRTIEALKVCSAKMKRRSVKRSRLVATEACRIAENSAEFIDRVSEMTGLKIEIVTRETEAKLAVSGCASLLDRNSDWALVFDIGGGSSELIWLDLTRKARPWRRSLYDRLDAQNCIGAWTSLPIGVVSLSEKFGGRYIDRQLFEDMVNYVMVPLGQFEGQHRISERIEDGNAHFMGTSGTVTTVAGIHLGLDVYDRASVDGCWIGVHDVQSVSDDLLRMSYEERVQQPCVGVERADLVLAGCAILEALLRTWPCDRLRVADRGLREGILATLMAEDRAFGRH